jgi:hypothetical protein
MYFWKSKYISKELQEHINRTLRGLRANKLPTSPAEEVKEFLKTSENILSSSATTKNS